MKKKKQTTVIKPRRIEVADLRARLAELEETLGAIRSGEVDALIVNGPKGDQVYSLKGAEQPYRAFIEQMNEGALTLDPTGTILYCNRRFAEMIQIPLERIISKNILPFISAADRAMVATMVAGHEPVSMTSALALKKGKLLPVRITVSTLEGADASARCVVLTDLTDQHERKSLTEALARLQASQSELQKQYLEVQETRAKLEKASTAKDEFLAALSHELRTPLTPVLLAANAMVVDPKVPAEVREDLEMIRRNVELEARLIDDLLDLTRIARGKLQINPQPTDLHSALNLALDICQSDTATKNLRFTTKLGAGSYHINAEAVRLQQIFWNLIRNAVKFTPPSGKVSVTTKNHRPDGAAADHIVITVTDSGVGINSDDLKKIFDAFEQGSGEVTRRFGGLGLGLTITRRLVELHGGTISAASKGAGRGATFVVRFPTIDAPVLRAGRAANGHPAKVRASLRILLVEDHDDTRRNMARLLTALNHVAVTAKDAATALQLAASDPFDLVISDLGLPDESGFELMKKLRARFKLPGICISGYGMEDDIARSRAAGFSDHLTKPINFKRLETAIAQSVTASHN